MKAHDFCSRCGWQKPIARTQNVPRTGGHPGWNEEKICVDCDSIERPAQKTLGALLGVHPKDRGTIHDPNTKVRPEQVHARKVPKIETLSPEETKAFSTGFTRGFLAGAVIVGSVVLALCLWLAPRL